MGIFFDLFSPGQRHRVDEQERLEHTREVESPSEPGRGPIDLSAGVVVIKPPSSAADQAAAEGSAPGQETAGSEEAEQPDEAAEPGAEA
jgi:hypothetical protein